MENLPNEIAAAIYVNLSIRDKFAFGATCRAYHSFVPEGFSKFARGFARVINEINGIKYMTCSELGARDASTRKYKGRITRYMLTSREVFVSQFVHGSEAQAAQTCRRYTMTSIWADVKNPQRGSGVTTTVKMCLDTFDLGGNTPAGYRVCYLLMDKLR